MDDKGQRVPFSRRGRDSQSSSDDDDTKKTVPRASRPAKPGLPMPLLIDEYSYVIVDNGAANPGELAIGRVQGRQPTSTSSFCSIHFLPVARVPSLGFPCRS